MCDSVCVCVYLQPKLKGFYIEYVIMTFPFAECKHLQYMIVCAARTLSLPDSHHTRCLLLLVDLGQMCMGFNCGFLRFNRFN